MLAVLEGANNRQLAMVIDEPRYWHIRAEEARMVAEQMSSAESKRTMLEIAANYERLADIAEQRLRAAK
jgi:hypothetical protein